MFTWCDGSTDIVLANVRLIIYRGCAYDSSCANATMSIHYMLPSPLEGEGAGVRGKR
jgi:hypothetical protein